MPDASGGGGQTVSTNPLIKVFVHLFQKVAGSKGRALVASAVGQTVITNHLIKFRSSLFKGLRVKGRALVDLRRDRNLLTAFLLVTFLWAFCPQRKVTINDQIKPHPADCCTAVCGVLYVRFVCGALPRGLWWHDDSSQAPRQASFVKGSWNPKAFIRLTKPLPWERWHAQA